MISSLKSLISFLCSRLAQCFAKSGKELELRTKPTDSLQAESLESRILYSAAPVEAPVPEAPPSESAPASAEVVPAAAEAPVESAPASAEADPAAAEAPPAAEAPAPDTAPEAEVAPQPTGESEISATQEVTLIDLNSAPEQGRTEIVFISSEVFDHQSLAANVSDAAEVIVLDGTRDGVSQIADALAGKTEIDAIHLITHGESGSVHIGTAVVDSATLAGEYADEFTIIREALSENADFLIYGCNVAEGEAGASFVQQLATATGADVAASEDATGAAVFGGDWDLETELGNIETASATLPAWNGLLVPGDTDNDGVADTIDIDDDNDGILDVVEQTTTLASISETITYSFAQNNLGNDAQHYGLQGTGDADDPLNYFDGDVGTEGRMHVGDIIEFSFGQTIQAGSSLTFTEASGGGADNEAIAVYVSYGTMDAAGDALSNLNDEKGVGYLNTVTNEWATLIYSGPSDSTVTVTVPIDATHLQLVGLASHGGWGEIDHAAMVVVNGTKDTDGDGILDHLDLDSDNDGISDMVESGASAAQIAASGNDGTVSVAESAAATGASGDADGDGLLDIFDADIADVTGAASIGTVPIDTDFDGLTDTVDLDSDADGIADTVEARPTLGYAANDGDVTNNDFDGDGVIDLFDTNDTTTNLFGGTFVAPVNTDGSGNIDTISTDFSGTAIAVAVETNINNAVNALGAPDGNVAELDNGSDVLVLDLGEIVPAGTTIEITAAKTDDGAGNTLDVSESDATGATLSNTQSFGFAAKDVVETISYVTTAATRYIDLSFTRSGGKLEIDAAEYTYTIVQTGAFPDYRDRDSDDDGKLDATESGLALSGVDANRDGIDDSINASYADPDGDINTPSADLANEGGSRAEVAYREIIDPNAPIDTDGDGIDDADDIDDDNDGILDVVEQTTVSRSISDTITYSFAQNNLGNDAQHYGLQGTGDGDDPMNYFDGDVDTEGRMHIGDIIEFSLGQTIKAGRSITFTEASGGGADNEAIAVYVSNGTMDAAGDALSNLNDGSGVGYLNTVTNGLATLIYSGPSDSTLTFTVPIDATHLQLVGLASHGGWGEIDLSDLVVVDFTKDTDGDGVLDHLDLDSDNDGISDMEESGASAAQIAASGNDGTASLAESAAVVGGSGDADGDGLMDIFDANTADMTGAASIGTVPIDTDSDGLTDTVDLDSDADGIADTVEARPTQGYVANDGNVTNNDFDGDGVIDLFDSNDTTTGLFGGTFVAPVNTDGSTNVDTYTTNFSGTAIAVAVETNINNAANALGAPDGTFAELDNGSDVLVLDLGEIVPAGTTIEITAAKTDDGAGNTLDVSESDATGATLLNTQSFGFAAKNVAETVSYVTTGATRYIDLSFTRSGGKLEIDGVEYSYSISQTGVFQDYRDSNSDDDVLLDVAESGLALSGVDANYDGIDDSVNASYADPDGDVNTPSSDLANQTGDTTEVGYREFFDPNAPVADDSAITVDEESADTSLGLSAPTDPNGDTLTITVSGLPSVGTVTLADGTPVTNGMTLTEAQLTGLEFDAPADLPATTVTSFTYTVDDGTSPVVTGTTSITVNPINDAPVADNSTITVDEESSDTSLGLAAPTDADGDTTTITVSGLPSVGTVTLADGTAVTNGMTLTATELAGLEFDAPDDLASTTVTSFTYTVDDGTAPAVTGTTSITVNPINDPPVADDSTITVDEESTDTSLGLSAPTDVDGDTLTITVSGLPSVGTVTLADGTAVTNGMTLTATELAGLEFDAPDDLASTTVTSFTYTVDDGTAPAVTGTTSITVNPINDAPVADDSTITVAEESTDTSLGLSAPTDVDGPAATITVSGLPSVGTVTLADGTAVTNGMTLTATELAGLEFDAPEDLLATTVTSFTYTVDDGVAPPVTGTTSITVNPVNDPPVADDSTITVDEESTDTSLGLSAPTDVDGDTLTITVSGLPSVGTVTLADGTAVTNGMTLTATELAGLEFDAPDDLASTTVTSFTYTVDDGTAPAVTGTTSITVNPINDAPVADDSTITVDEESTDTSLGLSAPTDVDGPAATITVSGLPSVGTVTLADGTPVTNGMTLTATELAGLEFDAPEDLLATTVTSFTYTVDDGVAPPVTGTTSITVNPVNDPPVADDSTITVDEESTDTSLGLSAPTDVDGDTLTITVSGLPSVGTVTLADGTAVTNGMTLTATELAGLEFDAPDDLASTTVTSFTYTVDDGTAPAVTGTTSITVNPINDAPVADDSTITVDEESTDTSLGLSAPTDVDGDTTTITVSGLPSVGTVTLADGTAVTNGMTLTATELAGLEFDAPADLLATTVTSFTYTVDDGTAPAVTGTTSITVNPINDAPVADDSTITVDEESTDTSLGLTAPTDVDGDTTTITVSGLPSVGTVTLADGTAVTNGMTLTATELAGLEFDAPDDLASTTVTSFTYTVDDGTAPAVTGTTSITVNPINDAPVADDSTITAVEGSVDSPLGLSAPTDVDGPAATITVSGLPSIGTVTLADGTPVTNGMTLTATELAGLEFDAPASVASPTVTSFTYTVDDGVAPAVTGTTSITVNPVNDPPVADDSNITVDEESTDTSLGLAAPTDADGDTLTITVSGLPSVGTVTLADGTAVTNGMTLTEAQLTGLEFDAPADLLATTVTSFTYTVDDGIAPAVTGTTSITVNPINDAPVADDSTITVDEESTDTSLGLTAPTDVDGDTTTITVSGLPSVGTVTLADGTAVTNGMTLTATELAGLEFDAPDDLASTTVTSFTYTVDDGTAPAVTGTTSITVNPINDAPVADDSTITVDEESTDTSLGLSAPTDVDGPAATITVSGLPSVGTVTLADGTAVTNGMTLTATELAGLEFDAPADMLATTVTSFTYTVDDGTAPAVTGTTSITVNPINDAPVADDSTITVDEESTDTSLGLAAPTDADGDTTTITVSGLPSVGTVTLADGTAVTNGMTLTATELAGLEFDAPDDLASTTVTSFTYTVDDGTAPAVTGTTSITVNPINDAPVADDSTITVDEESSDTSLGLAAPTDADGDTLTITVSGLPSVGTVTLADGTAVTNGMTLTATELAGLEFDAPDDLASTTVTSFTYTVDDGTAPAVTGTTSITVNPINDAPVADDSTITVDEESSDTSLGLAAPTDADGDTLTITVSGLPSVGTVTLADGTAVTNGMTLTATELAGLEFDAPDDLASTTVTSFTYTVDDGTAAPVTGTTAITVNPINDAPVADDSTITVDEESTDTSLGLSAPTDVDGDTTTITVSGLPSVGTVTLADGTAVTNGMTLTATELAGLEFDAPADLLATTVTSFTYTVDDGTAPAVTGTTSITVNPINDAPVADDSTITVDEESTDTSLGLSAPTDVDGDTTTITVSGLPSVGTVTLADGTAVTNGMTLTATELAGLEFDAPDDLASTTVTSFTYTVDDGTAAPVTGTTAITVNPINDAPVADDSTITAVEGSVDSPLGLSAPTDVDGPAATITVSGLPSVGTVTLADGTAVTNGMTLTATELAGLEFDAPASVASTTVTSFTYTVDDGVAPAVTGTTSITVNPVNDPPVADDSTITVDEESSDTSLGLSAPTDADGDTLTITVSGLPSVGTVTLADGTAVTNGMTLTATELAGLEFDAPADLLATMVTSFTYTVDDGIAPAVTGTTSITVNPINDAPVADDSTITVDEESTDTSLGLSAPTDVDGDTVTITVSGLPSVGTVTLADGTAVTNGMTLTATELAGLEFDAPDDLASTTVTSFTYTVDDGTAPAVTGTTSITVNPINDAPVADDSTITAVEGSVDSPLGLSAPTDVDGPTATITVSGLPSVGTVTLADGTAVTNGMTLTATELAGLEFDAPASVASTTVTSFTYTVDDGVAPAVTGTTSITVNPVNDPPVADDSNITVDEESTDTSLGLSAPTDADGDTLTITVSGLPSVGTVTLADGTAVTNGMTLTEAQLTGLEFDAPEDLLATTVTSFTYTIDDGVAPPVTGTTSITVNPVNDPPVADDSTITVDEESTDTSLGLTAPTDVDGDTTTITVSGLPSVGTVTLADGTAVTNGMTLTATELAGLEFDAPDDLASTTVTSFTYTVDDGTAPAVTGTTAITVNPINDAPVADDSTITVDEESTDTSLGLTAPTDVDGDTTTITVSGLPSVGTVTLADGTAVTNGMTLTATELAGLEFDAPEDLASTTVTSFTYTVDDGTAAPVTGTTSITVNPINDAPVADDSTITAVEGSVDSPLGLSAPTDVDGPAATITVSGLPSVGTVTLADGTAVTNGMTLTATELAGLEFDAPVSVASTTVTSFTYTVDDGVAPPVTGTTSITVNPVGGASPALTISDVSADESGVLTFTVTLDNPAAGPFTVDLAATSGTAAAGLDFSGSQTLTFAGTPGETQTFTVTPNDDGIIEIDETFTVVMSNSSNLAVNISDTAIGTILDNDARPAGVGVTTDIELVANGSGGFDLVIEDVETNSPIGFASEVPVADSADDLFIERVGDNYVIRDEGGLALGSPIIGAIRGGDNEIIVPVAMVTGDIIFRTGIEDDTVTVGNLGATIAGGLFIDTEDPANRFNDFDVIDYNSSTAMAAGSDAVFRAETINALEHSRLEAGAAGTVFWDAGRNISMAAGSVVASADGDITYEANLAGQFTDNFVAVHLKGAEIASTSANVDVDGRAGDTGNYNRGALLEFGSAIRAGGQVTIDGTGGGGGLYGTGVAVHGSMVESTGAGPVRITGTGGDGTLFNEGISIQNWSAIDAGSGDLILEGTGGSTGHYNRGINAGASSFRSSGGDITVDGTGGGSGLYSMGARFTVSDITTNGIGTITMRGTGAGGTLANMGLQVSSGSTVSTVDGAILLEGTGDGSSLLNHGVQVTKSTVSASGAGTVTVIGTGGVGTIQNQGVEIGGSIVAVNDGKLTITGTGLGTVINNKGVNVFDSTLSSSGVADIEVTGTGSSAASSSQNVGAYFGLKTIITASGTGNVTLTGTGGTGSIQNHGVILETNASVTLASGNLVVSGTGGGTGSSSLGVGINAGSNLTVGGSGTATITGIGANGTMLNNGVRISSFSSVQVTNGDLTITGTGRGSTSLNDGIKLSHAVLTATGSGNIIISGTGSQTATGIYNTGINMLGGSVTTASGDLTMTGLGGSGTTLNQSIRMSSAMLKSTGGDISVIGTSNGSTSGLINTGVYMLGVTLDGNGIIGITGIGGGGTMMNHGVTMGSITVMGSEPTCIGFAGGGAMSEDEDGDFLH